VARLQAVYYRDADGSQPVRAFLWALPRTKREALKDQIDRLNLLSDRVPHLPFPHSSHVEHELRELRCHYGRVLYRVLYGRSDRFLILLHAFEKRTREIPAGEKQLARERWHDFKAGMDAIPRRVPRPMGHDAP
jgi:phage-related protein